MIYSPAVLLSGLSLKTPVLMAMATYTISNIWPLYVHIIQCSKKIEILFNKRSEYKYLKKLHSFKTPHCKKWGKQVKN